MKVFNIILVILGIFALFSCSYPEDMYEDINVTIDGSRIEQTYELKFSAEVSGNERNITEYGFILYDFNGKVISTTKCSKSNFSCTFDVSQNYTESFTRAYVIANGLWVYSEKIHSYDIIK